MRDGTKRYIYSSRSNRSIYIYTSHTEREIKRMREEGDWNKTQQKRSHEKLIQTLDN